MNSDDLQHSQPSLSVPAQERMDAICADFEAGWKAGQNPRIEDYLNDFSGLERRELLRELLRVELEYRTGLGQNPSSDDYASRFPDDADLIAAVFSSRLEQPRPDQHGRSRERAGGDAAIQSTVLFAQGSDDSDAVPPGTKLAHGSRFGDYDLLGVIGEGGMGIVYMARQRTAGRIVALKVIRPDRLAGLDAGQRREFLERFRIEAEAAARLEHDHIVGVYDVGEVNGCPYFSMQFIDGRSLDQVLAGNPLEGREAARLLEPVARAVQAAHEQGIIHRDLKPRNILVDKTGRPYVADFGLAKSLEHAEGLTQTGDVIGTPAYMSPEQALGRTDIDHRTDVYSLGATLYELLTGRPPFRAATPSRLPRGEAPISLVPSAELCPDHELSATISCSS